MAYEEKPALPKPIPILGLQVMPIRKRELHDLILEIVRGGGHALIPNVNVHFANLAWKQPWLRDFFNGAPVNFCDGVGIMFAARILGRRIPERITFADWMWDLCDFAAGRGMGLFFLGGTPGAAEASADELRSRYPALRILGCQHGFFEKSPGSRENEEVVATINRLRPDILMVAFGMPLQERWLKENWPRLDARVALTGGAVFDYLSGMLRRPPRLFRRLGLEWLGRLLIEPRRLWRRYLVGNPLFLWRLLEQRLTRRTQTGRVWPHG